MIRITRIFFTFLLAVAFSTAMAQSTQSTATTSSPYSRYGLGIIDPALLPQTRAMGGIGTAVNTINNFYNINMLNPASYGAIHFTVIDAGLYSNIESLSQTGAGAAQKNANFRLSHVAFAFPVTKRSALSFGLMPYSEMGYNYKQTKSNYGTGIASDTSQVNYIYSGNGGLSKAYLGYGFGVGKHILLGANVSYIFGNLLQYQSTEIPNLYGVLNSRIEQSNSVGGLNYDLGTQVSFDLSQTSRVIFGYSASLASTLNSQSKYIVSQYQGTSSNESAAADSLINNQATKSKINLPLVQHFGVSYQKDGKFLVGADYSIGKWSGLTIDGVNQGLQNSQTFNIGGQITPNINALSSYWALVDYRLGFMYQKTNVEINNYNITQKAITFGLGFPLRSERSSTFYKINFSAEVGKRGTLMNGLVQDNYVNIHLSFTLNDRWFLKYRFD